MSVRASLIKALEVSMRSYEDRTATPASTGTTPPTVTQCPFCRSPQVATTGDAGSASTYWRCAGCG